MRATVWLLTAALAAPLAGCAAGGGVGSGDFRLEPARIGWNVSDVASFRLTLDASGDGAAAYTIDPVFAVQSVRLDTAGVGGDHTTDRPEDLGLELADANGTVPEKTLTPADPQVEVRLRLPDELKDDVYRLELTLFKAGTVKSDEFRVNVP